MTDKHINLEKIKAQADSGNTNNQIMYAKYLIKNGDLNNAENYLKLAIGKGNNKTSSRAYFYLGVLYLAMYKQSGNWADEKIADNYFKKSADGGYSRGCLNHGIYLIKYSSTKIGLAKANKYFEKGVKLGNTSCYANLGYVYYEQNNKGKAFINFEKGAELGDPQAIINYSIMCFLPNFLKDEETKQEHREKAKNCLKKLADNGNKDATILLSKYFPEDELETVIINVDDEIDSENNPTVKIIEQHSQDLNSTINYNINNNENTKEPDPNKSDDDSDILSDSPENIIEEMQNEEPFKEEENINNALNETFIEEETVNEFYLD